MAVQEQQAVDPLSAGLVDKGLRQQLRILFILQCVATVNDSLTHNTVNHKTLCCYVLLSASLGKTTKQYTESKYVTFGTLKTEKDTIRGRRYL